MTTTPMRSPFRPGGWLPEVPPIMCRPAFHLAIAALAVILLVARAGADTPVAPSPEAIVVDARVEPASFTTPAASSPSSAAVPLGPQAPAASRAAAPRPLPDWRLLAALCAAFAVLAGYRLVASRRVVPLPADVFEVLGEAPLGGQHAVRIVRFGPRTLLLGVSSAGCQTLAELSDPQATEAIVAACRGGRGAAVGDRRATRREARA